MTEILMKPANRKHKLVIVFRKNGRLLFSLNSSWIRRRWILSADTPLILKSGLNTSRQIGICYSRKLSLNLRGSQIRHINSLFDDHVVVKVFRCPKTYPFPSRTVRRKRWYLKTSSILSNHTPRPKYRIRIRIPIVPGRRKVS